MTETVSVQVEIMEVLYEAARREDGERDARVRAKWALERLDPEHKAEILVMYAAGEVERIWRAEARAAEKDATGKGATPSPKPNPGGSSGSASGVPGDEFGNDGFGSEPTPEPVSEYEVWLRDPSLLDWGRGGRALGKQAIKDFLAWLGDRRAEWYERGRAMGLSHCFLGDFAVEGADAYHEALTMMNIDQLIEEIASRMHVEPEPALLASPIDLGDGTSVTWGKATVAQLEQRIMMYKTKQVAGNANAAARVLNVVNQLKAAGASCFEELA